MQQPPSQGPTPNPGNERYAPFPPQNALPPVNYPSYPPPGSPTNYPPQFPQQKPSYTSSQTPYNAPTQQYQVQPPPLPPTIPVSPIPPRKTGFRVGYLGMAVILIFGLLIGFVSGFGIGHSGPSTAAQTTTVLATAPVGVTPIPTLQPTDTPFPTPTPPAATPTQASSSAGWTTTHTFQGDKISRTAAFTVGDTWNIQWSCDPESAPPFNSYNFIVNPMNSDGTLGAALGINESCQDGNTSGNVIQHGGGTIYLQVNCTYTWKINVQEMK